MKRLFLTVLLALVLHTGPGRADDRPPRYDMDSHCSRLATTPEGFSVDVEQKCFMTQSDAQSVVKRIWASTPDYIQRDCNLRAHVDGGEDYSILQNCIHDLLRQAPPDLGVMAR